MWVDDYFTDMDPDRALREMQRELERSRILAQVSLILAKRDGIKQSGKQAIQTTAGEMKASIKEMRGQLDTGLKGQVRKAIEEAVQEYSDRYDGITNG